jgi:ricin-type beta-trefoil lectin protein
MQVGHNASLWTCAPYADQQWDVTTSTATGYVIIQNIASGYCIGVNSTSNNAIVQPMQCDVSNNPSAQKVQWHLYNVDTPDGPGLAIQNTYSWKCLLGFQGQINVAVTQYTCAPYGDQAWKLQVVF